MSAFANRLLAAFPLENWLKRRVCIAVSGGADSVALFRGMTELAERFDVTRNLFVTTVDHRLRGAESAEDARFALELAGCFGIEAFALSVDVEKLQDDARRLGSWEEAARMERYRLLIDTAKKNSARFLLVAHHQDDQLETLLFRIFRGSGFDGLKGISTVRRLDESLSLVRPMLNLSRVEVLEYLKTLNQPYRTDSSNASSKYLRNRVRNELAPLLDELFPNRWQSALIRLSQLADNEEKYFASEVEKLERKIEEARNKQERFRADLVAFGVKLTQSAYESGADYIDIPRNPIVESSDEIALRYFRKLWTQRKWSLRSMGAEEWIRLTRAVRMGKKTSQFPDDVFLTFPDEETARLAKRRLSD